MNGSHVKVGFEKRVGARCGFTYFLIAGAVLLSLTVARVGFVLVERWRYSLSRPVFSAGFPAI